MSAAIDLQRPLAMLDREVARADGEELTMAVPVWLRSRSATAMAIAVGLAVGAQPLAAAPARASVGVNVFLATSAVDSEAIKSTVARCPAGLRIFGGGARLFNDGGRVTLSVMAPWHNSSGDGYTVTATERPGGTNEDWHVQAYAICGPALPGMSIVSVGTSGPVKQVFAACPAGRVVVGTGAAVGATTQGAVLYQMSPEYSSSAGYGTYVGAAPTAHGNPPPDFAVIAWAVCANEPAGYDLRDQYVIADGDESPVTASMTCNGQLILGTGGAFSSDIAFMTSIYNSLFVAKAVARKAREAPSAFWRVHVWAICAD